MPGKYERDCLDKGSGGVFNYNCSGGIIKRVTGMTARQWACAAKGLFEQGK